MREIKSNKDRDARDRIFHYLQNFPEGATSGEIAMRVLRLQGGSNFLFETVIHSVLEDDERFFRDEQGRWIALSGKKANSSSSETLFMVCCLHEVRLPSGGKRVGAIALQPVEAGQAGSILDYDLSAMDPEEDSRVREEIRGILEDAALVTFDRGRTARSLREFLGAGVDEWDHPEIFLQRLGKRLFGITRHPSLPELCDRLDIGVIAEGSLSAEIEVLTEVFQRLLEMAEEQGSATLEALLSEQAPRPSQVDFSRYAFNAGFLANLPARPGVYSMYDIEGRLLYVGKTKNLKSRVNSYFRGMEDRPKKLTRLLESLYHLEVRPVGSDLEAQLIEARLIRQMAPEINIQTKVHPRDTASRMPPNLVAVLRSADPECVELFLLRDGFPLEQVRTRRDFSDWKSVSERVRGTFFETTGPETLSTDEREDLHLVRSTLGRLRDRIHKVNVDNVAGPEDLMEKIREEVRELDDES